MDLQKRGLKFSGVPSRAGSWGARVPCMDFPTGRLEGVLGQPCLCEWESGGACQGNSDGAYVCACAWVCKIEQ